MNALRMVQVIVCVVVCGLVIIRFHGKPMAVFSPRQELLGLDKFATTVPPSYQDTTQPWCYQDTNID